MARYCARPFFKTVEDLYAANVTIEASETEQLHYVLSPIADFFKFIYVPVEKLDSTGAVVKTYENIGMDLDNIVENFYSTYSNRFYAYSFKEDTVLETFKALDKGKFVVKSIMGRNSYKYLKLIETLGYTYDPTNNYDMKETSGNWESDGGITSTETPSGSPVTKNYRTQYDDQAESGANLESYSKTEFGDYKNETKVEHEKLSTVISSDKDVYEIGSNDIDKFAGSKIRRYGNIGVTTTQQMIEAQRQLVRFNIIQELFNDLDKELLMNLYSN